MSGNFYVIGSGLAGLSAAVRLASQGKRVRLLEAQKYSGGRCRSFFDDKLQITIDNGNHLILSGNEALLSYMDMIGSLSSLEIAARARYQFYDCRKKELFHLDFSNSPFAFLRSYPPECSLRDVTAFWHMMRAGEHQTLREALKGRYDMYYEQFLNPMSLAILNTDGSDASARSLWRLFRLLMRKGGGGLKPCLPRKNLSRSLIDPALSFIKRHGGEIFYQTPVRKIECDAHKIRTIHGSKNSMMLDKYDKVILAVPEYFIEKLLPSYHAPCDYRAIMNVHFKYSHGKSGYIVGLLHGLSHWIFVRPMSISVTISAVSDSILAAPRQYIGEIWGEVCAVLGLSCAVPPYRCLIEKRATFAQTPIQEQARGTVATEFDNLFIASQWVRTGYPATLEGAVHAGVLASKAAMG